MRMLKRGLLVGGAISLAIGAMIEPEDRRHGMLKTTRFMLRKGMRMMSMVKKMM